MDKKQIGYFGEDAVCRSLEKRGYKILKRNFTIRGGEIDIIAEKDEFVVFVEVKTRKSDSVSTGAEAVTKSKQKLVAKTAAAFMALSGNLLQPRFDVAEVVTENDKIIKINYITNAFDTSGFSVI